MKQEQLEEIRSKFKQLEELQSIYEVLNRKQFFLNLSYVYDSIVDPILDKFLRKYEKLMIEDLKKEIQKRETELEGISIVKLNKLV